MDRRRPTRENFRHHLSEVAATRPAYRVHTLEEFRQRDSVTTPRPVEDFFPRGMPREAWERIRPIVISSVLSAGPSTAYAPRALLTVTSSLARWCDQEGMPLTLEVVFHPDTIDRFIAQGCSRLATGTRLNYRNQLRRMGEQLLDPHLFPRKHQRLRASAAVRPYSAKEAAALVGWVRGLRTTYQRDNTLVLLALGLGAGLRNRELTLVVGSDVTVNDDGVQINVSGTRARVVPVLRRWESDIARIAAASGDLPLWCPTLRGRSYTSIEHFTSKCPRGDAPPLVTQRLRATWIAYHLLARTPLCVLQVAAGVGVSQLAKYATTLPMPELSEARRMLRDATVE